ncbi:hypothetical protein GIB67_002176 [Kingdonia uniflora]|uniref:protein-serine/threonine phosphatase n=1 Tax=Kingdonia uniflora TaxID=39325 RepID=A0A7J7KWL7_9MAGN|nr:hypothetical protein GIB67_002176 [Kingdonia uniflora]
MSCGYSSFRGKRASMEDFYNVKMSKIDSQTVSMFGVFDGHGESNTYRDDGSTTVTAVMVGNYIYVANLGDSRAVISKAGQAIPLSEDHKPNRSDERKRIENAGGVVMWDGTWRVDGVYGRVKPDIVAYGQEIMRSKISTGCKSLSATSMASPVSIGVVCLLPLYADAMSVMFNATVLNGMGLIGYVEGQPTWHPNNDEGNLLSINFSYSKFIWPWTGYLPLHMQIKDEGAQFSGLIEGNVTVNIFSPPPPREKGQRGKSACVFQLGDGRISVYGDSNCLESSHMVTNYFWLLNKILDFTSGNIRDPVLFSDSVRQKEPLYWDDDQLRSCQTDVNFSTYSAVLGKELICRRDSRYEIRGTKGYILQLIGRNRRLPGFTSIDFGKGWNVWMRASSLFKKTG